MNVNEMDNCPECNHKFKGEDILQHFMNAKNDSNHPQHKYYGNYTDEQITEVASHYGYTKENPKFFSNIIGIEYQGVYDGTLAWQCPNCKTTWGRFSGEKNPDPIKERNFYFHGKPIS